MSSKDSYGTPPEVFAYMNSLYHFVMDVAASDSNHLHDRYLTEEQDALALDWRQLIAEDGRFVWCNPPYSNIAPWVSKATEQAWRGVGTVMLVMADQSVGWFAEAVKWCNLVLMVTGGRLSFIDPATGKPAAGNNKGSMFLIWYPGGLHPHQEVTTRYLSRDIILRDGRGWIDTLQAIHNQPTAEPTETVDNLELAITEQAVTLPVPAAGQVIEQADCQLDQSEHPLDMETDHSADVSKMVDEPVTCLGCNRQYLDGSPEAEFIGWHGECAACQLQEGADKEPTAKPLDEWFWDYQHGDSLSLDHGQWPRFVVVLTILYGIQSSYMSRQVANAISICDEQLMAEYTNLTQEQQERIRRCAMALAETEKAMPLTDTQRQQAVTALLPHIDANKLPLFEAIKIMREAVQEKTMEGEAA